MIKKWPLINIVLHYLILFAFKCFASKTNPPSKSFLISISWKRYVVFTLSSCINLLLCRAIWCKQTFKKIFKCINYYKKMSIKFFFSWNTTKKEAHRIKNNFESTCVIFIIQANTHESKFSKIISLSLSCILCCSFSVKNLASL